MTLEQKIDEKIGELAPVLELLPGVAMLHRVGPQHPVYMSKRGLDILEISLERLQSLGDQYYELYFNMDDTREFVPKIVGLLDRNNNDEMVSYFQQVRHGINGNWHVWLCSTKICMWDENRVPILHLTMAVPVDPDHNISSKIERIVAENSFLRNNKNAYSALTVREKEVLRLMALDKPSTEIAELLSLSDETVKTHRRNIKKKINAKNQYDVVKFSQAFEIV